MMCQLRSLETGADTDDPALASDAAMETAVATPLPYSARYQTTARSGVKALCAIV